VLVGATAVTALLYLVPWLRWLAWPLLLLSTVAHEMAHGVAAVFVGGRFEALLMWSDGSGAAAWSAHVGRLGRAFVAAAGLVGPALAAAGLFIAGRSPKGTKGSLIACGVVLLVADLWVVRTLFGFMFVGLLAAALIVVGVYGRPWLAQSTLVFLAVQLALSVFSRADYLFTATARTAGGPMPSDTARIAEALLLPYWFWGACCGLLSLAVLGVALHSYLRLGRA
jgi:hypothetical protein